MHRCFRIFPILYSSIILIILLTGGKITIFEISGQPRIVHDTIIRPFSQPDTLRAESPLDSADSDSLPPAEKTSDLRENRPFRSINIPSDSSGIDLPKSAIPWYTEEQLQNPFALTSNYVDTTLLGFQMYDFAAENTYFFAEKGNPGHAHRLLTFSPDLTPGLKLNDRKLYGNYLLAHDDLKFYRPKHVFTDLFYLTGTNREQLFYAKHAQKLQENFTMAFQYRIVHTPGAFSRLAAVNSNLSFTADYLSKDKRYQVLGSFILNRIRNQESGGLKNFESFEQDPVRDSVFLYRAESWVRDVSFNLRHFYQTGFYTRGDSAEPARFINLGRINHDFTYQRTAFVHNDQAEPYSFYDFPRLDSTSTFDSTVVHRIENQISWSNFPLSSGRGTFPFNFKLFLKHSINTIQQPDVRPPDKPITNDDGDRIYYGSRESFNSLIQGIELNSDQRLLISFGGHANATIGGYHDEDLHAGAFLNIGQPDKKYHLESFLNYSLSEAPYFYNHLSVNNIRWNNDFQKMQIVNLKARLHTPYVKLEGNYFLLDRMVYLGKEALPVQNNVELGFFSLGAYSDIRLGRFGFRNQILLQQATSENFEDYPTLISYHSVAFNIGFFDNALVNQFGFDFHFNTGYNAMAYMPVSRGFYLQDQSLMDNKYLVDFFWNGKISNARLFIKYQNLLGMVLDIRPHYDIPFYPIPESMFKFGVSWMFFN
jgi:hypothetical protein